jgi:hypothetical protein
VTQHSRDRIITMLDSLSDSQLELLRAMAAAMADGKVRVSIDPESDLVTPEFSDAFANFVLLHHAIYQGPLSKEAFEYVFSVANETAGRAAVRNTLRGSNTHDVAIDGVKWSLKTEAGRDTRPNKVRIEKWMEARWIRECTNPAECAMAMQRVVDHMADYQRIAVLQAEVSRNQSSTHYRLFELPHAAISSLTSLHHSAFKKEGSKRSYGADLLATSGSRVFRILLDSSVEKVRIWFDAANCTLHGSWEVMHAPKADSDRLNI